jgi:hypothetical protein
MPTIPVTYGGPLYEPQRYPDVKDPSPVFDGRRWHLFGTGCGRPGGLEIAHSTAPTLEGPWHEEPPARLVGADMVADPAAPGVIAEGDTFHLFLQHHFNVLGGGVEHLVSFDRGATFVHRDTALSSAPGTGEAGIYDPDAAVIGGVRYLAYAGMSVVGQPDLYLAASESGSWDGPWRRLGRILGHDEVEGHNRIGHPDYEWGLEGPHLLGLPDGRVLLTAVCFLAEGERGHRQRLLLAVGDRPEGPYRPLGPVVAPSDGRGENGHGTAVLDGDVVRVVYQERAGDGRPWRIHQASVPVAALPPGPGTRHPT